LADELHLSVVVAGSLLDLCKLANALLFSRRVLLAKLPRDALALRTLKRRLALLCEADAVGALAHLVDLALHGLSLALVGAVKLRFNHLKGERVAAVLLEALLH